MRIIKALVAALAVAGTLSLVPATAHASSAPDTRAVYDGLYTKELRSDVQAALGSRGRVVGRRDEGTWLLVRKVYPTSRPGVWVSVMYLQIRSLGEAEPWLAEKSWSRLGARPGW